MLNPSSNFWTDLFREFEENRKNWYGKENWDAQMFGKYQPNPFLYFLYLINSHIPRKFVIIPGGYIDMLTATNPTSGFSILQEISNTYDIYTDKFSKSLLIKLIVFRILGPHKIKLPLAENMDNRNKKIMVANSMICADDVIKIDFSNWRLNRFKLSPIGFKLECYSTPRGILNNFILKQYEYRKNNVIIVPNDGDCIIDAGGCWGDTALFFSEMVGESGKVFSFEFLPENIEIFRKNISLNKKLGNRITIVPYALSDKSGDIITYSYNGPGTSIKFRKTQKKLPKNQTVKTITIDDFVKENELIRVDFIKMDIEGSELNALKGAVKTMQEFRPKLAISVYHNFQDLSEIPNFIRQLNLNYLFFLDHFTLHLDETILFAVPGE